MVDCLSEKLNRYVWYKYLRKQYNYKHGIIHNCQYFPKHKNHMLRGSGWRLPYAVFKILHLFLPHSYGRVSSPGRARDKLVLPSHGAWIIKVYAGRGTRFNWYCCTCSNILLVSLNRPSLRCVTLPRRKSGHLAGFLMLSV